MDQFDGMLFGNGLTLNLIGQISAHIPSNKRYLLSVDEFMKKLMCDGLSPREEGRIFSFFYEKKDIANAKYMNKIKDDLLEYYDNHDSNIEYHLGAASFLPKKCGYDYDAVKSLFPFLYNIWHEILIEYLNHLKLDNKIHEFNKSVQKYFCSASKYWTTNFDEFSDLLCPQHLHGRFVRGIKRASELKLSDKNESELYFKCIWGWNGIGKLDLINELKAYSDYFDFKFFFDNDFLVNRMLVYGISFQSAGYMAQLATFKKEYEKPSMCGVIDEHILIRIAGLQNLKQLKEVTFAYYDDREYEHYKELVSLYKINNVNYVSSRDLHFSI